MQKKPACYKKTKKVCDPPCEWIVKKGCKPKDSPKVSPKASPKVTPKSSPKVKLAIKVSSQREQEVKELKKQVKGMESATKKDIAMMKELNNKTLMLNSRLRTVEDRLKKCNKERESVEKELTTCKSKLR